jgi:hypothetical protein
MATMIPSGLTEFQTQGEERVYRFIEAVAKPDDRFLCWYTPDIEDREPDFVLFARDLGLVVLEVKDWTLEQIREVTPRDAKVAKGARSEVLPNPIRQARECAMAVIDALREDGRLLHRDSHLQGKPRIPVNHGVILPNVNKFEFKEKEFDKVIPVDKTFFWDDLHPQSDICSDPSGQRFRAALENMFPPLFAFSLSGRELDFLREVLFPVVRIETPARGGEAFSQERDRLAVLDHNQESLARRYDSGHRIIRGPSGSGKTLVLAHKAALLLRCNPSVKRVLVLCYNITLAHFIRRLLAAKGAPLGPDGVDILPIFHLCARILDMPPSDEGEDPEFYDMMVQEAAEKAAGCGLRWDAVLIDEGQDFSDDMFKVATGVLNPATDNLTITLDDNQDIYRRSSTWKELGIRAKGRVHDLPWVYRNTREIADLAERFIGAEPVTGGRRNDQYELSPDVFGYHGPQPEFTSLKSLEDVAVYVASSIRDLTGQDCPLSEVAVLYASSSPKQAPGTHIPTLLLQKLEAQGILASWVSEDARAKRSYDVTTDRVAVSTIHSVKGLDYACAFLVGLEFLEPGRWTEEQIRRLVYVGMTRARYRLFIPYTSQNDMVQRLLGCKCAGGHRP